MEHEVDVDEIAFQTQCSYQHKAAVKPSWSTAEDAVQEQDARDGERDVEHALQEERKHAVLLLFQEDACEQRHQEHQPYHAAAGTIKRLLLANHLTHIDADEEDRYSAPEDFQMAYSLMNRCDVLHQDAPHNHHHRQPFVDGVALDEFHIGWGEEIEHHGGWDVPEGKLVVSPEIPVDGNLAYQVDPRLEVSSPESGNVVETGDDEPRRVDTQVTADEEMLGRRILHPGKPQADAAEKQKHIYSYIAHAAQSEESVLSRQCYMKENDEEHGGSHQFTAISADIRQFYVFYLHDFLLIFRVWNLLHQLGEEPCQTDARYDVEEQAGIDVSMTADRDEYLAGDGMGDEEGG